MGRYKSVFQMPDKIPQTVSVDGVTIYSGSFLRYRDDRVIMIKDGDLKHILAAGTGPLYESLEGASDEDIKVCPLSTENRQTLNRFFDFTVPRACGTGKASIGLGDRLGTASPGHIRAVRDRGVFPVLAQQSTRELTLTGRTFESVLNDACFAVVQEGWKSGYGADADHLKKAEDIKKVINAGYSMITLDCSDNIDPAILRLNADELTKRFNSINEKMQKYYMNKYRDLKTGMAMMDLEFDENMIHYNVVMYHELLRFVERIYKEIIVPHERDIDFEISIDETDAPTLPQSHYFIARELSDRSVRFNSMAPRFCGDFQKGVDYIGDIDIFSRELKIHAAIAEEFGYKLSIHSGSDKFRVFPAIGELCKKRFHLKTSGTHWLEALRLIAKRDPMFYRQIHAFALDNFYEAQKLYHVTADINHIKPLDEIENGNLSGYLDDDNARQSLHISYGVLLNATDGAGEKHIRNKIYRILNENEEEYCSVIEGHTARHLEYLGF